MDSSEQMRLEGALACVNERLVTAIERARDAPCAPAGKVMGAGESRRRAVERRLIDGIRVGAAS